MTETEAPRSVRLVGSPAAAALADLAAIFEDLQTSLMCCERLVEALKNPLNPDPVLIESLWTTALLSYSRCFAPGGRGMGLTEDDIKATEIEGEVVAWHQMLRAIKKHYADPAVNPRETFAVGVAVADGVPNGVAITSSRQDLPDLQTVHQTGALALGLSQLVDRRIGEHQATVLEGARALSPAELETLDEVTLAEDASGGSPEGNGSEEQGGS